MWLSDSYDVPLELVDAPHSPAFREFLLTWFGSTVRIEFGLPCLTVLKALSPDEITLAQELVRRNLHTRRIHIINATWALRDTSAAPLLRRMLEAQGPPDAAPNSGGTHPFSRDPAATTCASSSKDEPDESRRLTIAAALWKLVGDPVFLEYLERAKKSGLIASFPHLLQVLWLDDERALDFLIDLLPQNDEDKRRVALIRRRNLLKHTPLRRWANRAITKHNEAQGAGPWALIILNQLEFDKTVPPDQRHPPSHYRRCQFDPIFRRHMLLAIHKSNRAPQLDPVPTIPDRET